MAVKLNQKEIVTFEELLMSNVIEQEALVNLLVKKGIFTKKEKRRWIYQTIRIILMLISKLDDFSAMCICINESIHRWVI